MYFLFGKASQHSSSGNQPIQPPASAYITYLAHHHQNTYGTKKPSTSSSVACAGVAGGLAGIVGNPSEVCSSMFIDRTILTCHVDRPRPHVRRRREISSPEIRICKCNSGNHKSSSRGRPPCIFQGLGSKCRTERADE